MTIDAYVADVGQRLSKFGSLAARPLVEIREHLLESRDALVDQGMTFPEAGAEALRRFGSAEEIAGGIAAVLTGERDVMERIVKIVSVTNVFTAVWGLSATGLLNPTSELLVMGFLVSVVVVAGAAVAMRRNPDPGALVVSGVAVSAVGSAGVIWALMGGRGGQEPQIGLALVMAIYCAQGILAAWAGARRSGAESAASPQVS